ncbi:MAG: hypothetical protein LBJ32_04490 [Oscillospiraceae bacterium]|nr:hypothetical protein [Oscillospiraceae bacterium]
MENNNHSILERNNYFLGKLMTVRDFFCEQNYFNLRRRLCNRMMFGPGIVSGLNIFLIDERTFSLDPGIAIDYSGREIVVLQPCIRKLNLINGFEENKDKGAIFLCIKYSEKLSETTFNVTSSSQEANEKKQFNRIKEGYELFLTTQPPKENGFKIDNFVWQKIQIYDKNNVKIFAEFPNYASPGKQIKIKIYFEKEKLDDPANYSFKISGELFESPEGKFISVDYKETELSSYKFDEKEYFFKCTAQNASITELTINKNSFNLTIGEHNYGIEQNIKIQVSIRNENISELAVTDYYLRNFDENMENFDEKFIYLARFHLVSDRLNFFIEKFVKHPFKQYVYSNNLLRLMCDLNRDSINYTSQKPIAEEINVQEPKEKFEQSMKPIIEKDNIITGVEKINLGFNAKVGKSYYSYELVHGLGPGPVGIIAAVVNEASEDKNEKSLVIFGDKSIFDEENIKASAPNMQIAVAVDYEKGTFRIGARLKSKTLDQTIDIRWWAFRPIQSTQEKENLVIDETVKIIIKPNTARVKPLDQIRFEASVEGFNDQRIRWEIVEKNTGSIDSNGLYTAPATEGVYEIKAHSVEMPELSTSAYVVVSVAES